MESPLAGPDEFFDAVEAGDLTRIQSFLENDPSLVAAIDVRPIQQFIRKSAYMLLPGAPGGDTNRRITAYTALHVAAMHGQVAVARMLIAAGADVHAISRNQFTPLHGAVRGEVNLELVDLLLSSGADLNARSKLGFTPLREAILHAVNTRAVAGHLLAKGADPNLANYRGDCALGAALFRSASSDQMPVIEDLILYGAGVDAGLEGTKWNSSLLCRSIQLGKPEITRRLIEAGASIQIDAEGIEAPLHVAARCGGDQAVEMLLEAGADPNARDQKDRTPLDCLTDFLETIAILDRYAG